jgi:ATP-binding cassette subfamily B protein
LELRLLNIHHYFGKKIYDIWEDIIDKRLTLERKRRTAGFLGGVLDDAVAYGLDGVFALQILIGKITLGTGQAYIRAISNFKESLTSLTTALSELYENFLYIDDLKWFLNLEEPYFNKSGQSFPAKISKGIVFDNVWFRYPGTKEWILKGLSFSIDPEQNIAIIGKNGAGKTTLVKLLCGFYHPNKGKISIDGISVSDLNKTSYWNQVSALFQDFENYGVTARESITAGDTTKSSDIELIRSYARMTQIDDWILSLPLKYDNPLIRDFKHGISPSSGQAQRVGISRTLFKEGRILILDEPTSNVDPEAEEDIFNNILKLGQKKIIIFISHRFSTVRLADKIMVIEKGVVSEQGSHEKLLSLNGIYARLFRLQAKSYR